MVRTAVVRNVSEIGAFLETDPMPVGTRLRLKLATDEAERSAEVVWLEDPGPSTGCAGSAASVCVSLP